MRESSLRAVKLARWTSMSFWGGFGGGFRGGGRPASHGTLGDPQSQWFPNELFIFSTLSEAPCEYLIRSILVAIGIVLVGFAFFVVLPLEFAGAKRLAKCCLVARRRIGSKRRFARDLQILPGGQRRIQVNCGCLSAGFFGSSSFKMLAVRAGHNRRARPPRFGVARELGGARSLWRLELIGSTAPRLGR